MAAVHVWAVPAVLPVTIVRDASVSLRPRLSPPSPPSCLSGVPWLQGLTPLLATARIAPWGEILLAAFMSYPPGRWCAIGVCDVRYCMIPRPRHTACDGHPVPDPGVPARVCAICRAFRCMHVVARLSAGKLA